jgi:hypothetical protein
MTMQQVTGPFADRSPQGAAPRAGQAGFAETTVFDCATGRALARVAVPEGWAVFGQLERVRSFERPMRVRVLAQGPEGSRIEFQSGDRFCVLGAGVKGLGVMGAMYGITTSMQSSPERAFEDVETFLDKEAIAYAQRVGASIRLATTTGYPGGFDAAADRARSGHVAPDYTWTDGFSDAMRGVNTWVRPDGTEVETSTASDRAWTNAAGDVVGGSGGFDPGAGWTELHQR